MQRRRSAAPEGCTVGVVRLPDGILCFKNRDLGREQIENRITVFRSTPEFHTLDGVNLKTGGLEGVSIGVNRYGVCVANTHVLSTPDVPYDVLCERLVKETRERDDVPRVVRDFMDRNTVQGGRILVAAPQWAFLVEVLRKTSAVEELDGHFAMTNHFSLISHEKEGLNPPGQSSLNRVEVASKTLPTVSRIGQLKSLLRSHIPEKGPTSICNHGDGGGTETSHIIEVRGGRIAWSWLAGTPCENDYVATALFQ